MKIFSENHLWAPSGQDYAIYSRLAFYHASHGNSWKLLLLQLLIFLFLKNICSVVLYLLNGQGTWAGVSLWHTSRCFCCCNFCIFCISVFFQGQLFPPLSHASRCELLPHQQEFGLWWSSEKWQRNKHHKSKLILLCITRINCVIPLSACLPCADHPSNGNAI